MKTIAAFALLFAFAVPAAALAGPEEEYLAARNQATARLTKLEKVKNGEEAAQKAHEKALADLEKRLATIVGGLDVAGFPKTGKISLDSLTDSGVGYGMLDGLRFQQGDAGPTILISTEALLAKWLADWRKSEKKAAKDDAAALRSNEFYTAAIGSDAAFSKSATLDIDKPAGVDFAYAQMGGWAQDIGPNENQEIVVALRKGGKVYFGSAPVKEGLAKIPACDEIWAASQKKSEKLQAEYEASHYKNTKLSEESNRVQEKGDADFHACFNGRAPKEKWFPAVVRQAQDFAAAIAGK